MVTVARVKTVASEKEMALALALAYRNLTGKAPDPNTLGMMAAQSYLESGHGQSMYNWNFGGIKGDGAPGTAGVVVLPTHEVVDGEDKIYHLRFRAYLSMLDGATDHVRLLLRYYPSALACAAQGDCQGYAEALKSHGYFTAPVENWTDSDGKFHSGYAPLMERLFKPITLSLPASSIAFGGAATALVILACGYLALRKG